MNQALIDTDIIIKLGVYKGRDYLYDIVKAINFDVLIHEYIKNEELLQPENAIKQVDALINDGYLKVVSKSDLNTTETTEYESTLALLESEFSIKRTGATSKRNDEGEKRSLSYAFVKKKKAFISDDKIAAVIAKQSLKYSDDTFVEAIKLDDIVLFVKNDKLVNITRKEMRRLYTNTVSPKMARNNQHKQLLERQYNQYKKKFDNELWPKEDN